MAELWRDGRVPEWINVSVVGETGTTTVIELLSCTRFTDDDALLYHVREGAPPFHVLGPALPPEQDGTPSGTFHVGGDDAPGPGRPAGRTGD